MNCEQKRGNTPRLRRVRGLTPALGGTWENSVNLHEVLGPISVSLGLSGRYGYASARDFVLFVGWAGG